MRRSCQTFAWIIPAVLLVLVLLSDTVRAVECSAAAPRDRKHWSWRQVDGRKCWYPGFPGMSKDKLRWPTSRSAFRSTTNGSHTARPPASLEDELMLNAVWPPLPADSFDARFIGGE
jgi:hypothetical protein